MKSKLLLAAAVLFTLNSFSQTPHWQWGKGIGDAQTSVSDPWESVVDMAIDRHGNLYVLSNVMQLDCYAAGHQITGYGYEDMLITSFKCDGTYRWSKDIGTNSSDEPLLMRTDSLDGIYVVGGVAPWNEVVHFDTDTICPGVHTVQQLLIFKYDTSGVFQWYRKPEPDTISPLNQAYREYYDLDVTPNGTMYLLSLLTPGTYSNGCYIVSDTVEETFHIMKYDANGNCLGGEPLQISMSGAHPPLSLKMRRDKHTGNFLITGTLQDISNGGNLYFNNILINHTMFIGCFNSTGNMLWQRQDTASLYASNFTGRPALDAQGNIYLCAGPSVYADNFNGFNFNTYGPVALKMDAAGNNIWAKSSITNAATFTADIVVNENEAVVAGSYPGLMCWVGNNDTLRHVTNEGYDVFITRFNKTTGAVIKNDTLASSFSGNESPTAIEADLYGNYYTAGTLNYNMFIAGDTLNNISSYLNLFIAKYGTANCDSVLTQPAGIKELTKDNEQLIIYPNPFTSQTTIAFSEIQNNTSIIITDVLGNEVQSVILNGARNLTINKGTLQPGIYFVQITDENSSAGSPTKNRINRKIIIQ